MFHDDKKASQVNGPILYSTVQLLFEEPKGFSKVLSAEHEFFHMLEKIGTSAYVKTTPQGFKNTYYYKDCHLQKVEIHAGMINLIMQRK